jgi:hypothetical protein
MNPRLQLLVRTELKQLLKAGFIRPIEITDWMSPMVLVRKKNSLLRVCIDYWKLNVCTQKNYSFIFYFDVARGIGGICLLYIHGR